MATEPIVLNNYSDDSKIKQYISNVLMPRVFHDIPLNTLNAGFFSVMNEYMSQAIENMAFTGSFYHNESFITKSILPDSIYAEAAIFNIGYSFATPSCCNFMIELKIADLKKNSKPNESMKNVQEFVLDKNTRINLQNGSIYSLDYDILIQYTKDDSGNPSAWNIQYTNMDEQNSIAVNKKPYILYRTSEEWLCIFVKMSEIERQSYVVVNNMTNGIPNDDFVIQCTNNIAGFDVKYIDGDGNEQYLDSDHILALHSDVKDQQPYVHYIMDNPQTIRFKFQMNGNRYFVPKLNSRFEIIVYICHGDAANFSSYRTDESVSIITSTNRYTNNGNVQKTAFVISGSAGGSNIGTIETTRRETIEAYNTANVISSDHDIYEWFKTFFFKNIMYPFFFKRRDDPWGRIWSGFFALTDLNGEVFRTNTLHGQIPYRVLYHNNDNIIANNEIIIPPGWSWVYANRSANRFTVKPLVVTNDQVEPASTVAGYNEDFLFANPFGIRIQKQPFAIGYFNPWINETTTASYVQEAFSYQSTQLDDVDKSIIYHATPSFVHVTRTYQNDYYHIETLIIPNQISPYTGSTFVKKLRSKMATPSLSEYLWNYFVKPADMFAPEIPILAQNSDDQYIVFDPKNTYICARTKERSANGWILDGLFIDDRGNGKYYDVNIKPGFDNALGSDALWGDNGIWEAIKVTGDTSIDFLPAIQEDETITFNRVPAQNYYELRLSDSANTGRIVRIVTTNEVFETSLTKYGETQLYRIGTMYPGTVYLTIYYDDGTTRDCSIYNAANIYTPYTPHQISENQTEFQLDELTGNSIVLYADMKPTQSEAAIDYYRIPLELIDKNTPLFYLLSSTLSLNENELRVVMEAKVNGVVTGRVEMQPVNSETDGSIRFDTVMHPLNKMVDVDNRIQIASLNNGGGSWKPATENAVVGIDATTPELTLYILFKSADTNLESPIDGDPSYIGYRLQDKWNIDPIPFVEELKEMRSVVHFGEYLEPKDYQIDCYDKLNKLGVKDPSQQNIATIKQYAHDIIAGLEPEMDFNSIRVVASEMNGQLEAIIIEYSPYEDMPDLRNEYMTALQSALVVLSESQHSGDVDWNELYSLTASYLPNIDEIFSMTSVNSSIEIQLMPLVQASMMNSDMFEHFVNAFTQIHKAIEPVIFQRLEGNNYLDCKLIATYGLPHSYVADMDKDMDPPVFWPDLDIQIEFDIKLYNPALSTNTLQELKQMIKSYFNRITTVHTPIDMISMNNNIYISQLIQQMESHPNVAYMKFKGWYTNQKNIVNGHYMNADYQAIVQKWDTLEDMPTKELERYVPEMFVLSDSNIVLNII